MPEILLKFILPAVIVIALAFFFVFLYVVNKNTKKPEGCEENVCSSCLNEDSCSFIKKEI